MAALCGNGRLRKDCRQGFPYDDSIPIGLLLIFPLTLHTNRPGYRNIDHRFTVGSHFQDGFCGTEKFAREEKKMQKIVGFAVVACDRGWSEPSTGLAKIKWLQLGTNTNTSDRLLDWLLVSVISFFTI